MYKMAGVELTRKDGKYIVTVDGKIVEYGVTTNPILAWRRFLGCVDDRVCRRIGDYLETQGLDRYTGETQEEKERRYRGEKTETSCV